MYIPIIKKTKNLLVDFEIINNTHVYTHTHTPIYIYIY